MGKSYKPKRRKIYTIKGSQEIVKKKENITETLDRIGYREEKDYRDCCSHLAW